METMMDSFIKPDWPAPPGIQAYTTRRYPGNSKRPYDSFNMGLHVGDNPSDVMNNRLHLTTMLSLPSDPIWIQQQHTTIAIQANEGNRNKIADASFTMQSNTICAVLTADCLPILLCNLEGTMVASIHAGWRGLCAGIISETLSAISMPPQTILAWLGPAISMQHFEIGAEVRHLFLKNDPDTAHAFTESRPGHFLADLYAIARLQLKKQGVSAIYGGNHCTYSQVDQFFSYRRDGHQTGRMASLIWFTDK